MLQALVMAETVAIALLGVLVVGLLRSHGEVLRTLHKIGAGLDPDSRDVSPRPVDIGITTRDLTAAAPIVGVTLADEAVSWPVTGDRDVLLAFLSSGCTSCEPFWEAFGRGAPVPGGADLLIVVGDADRESETLLRRLAPRDVPLVMSTQAWHDYDVPGSPHFVYIDGAAGTVVGEGTGQSWEQVAALLERAAGDRRLAAQRPSVDAELVAAGVGPGDARLFAAPGGPVT